MAKSSKGSGRALLDSRGLPPDLDPRKFYEYSISQRMESSEGIEWYLYRLMSPTWIRSFAIAIDPFSALKRSNTRITPSTRLRKRSIVSVLDSKNQMTKTYDRYLRSSVPNWNNIPGTWGPVESTTWHSDTSGTSSGQTNVPDEMRDTTASTRLMGSQFGEARSFETRLSVPSHNVTRVNHEYIFSQKNPDSSGMDYVRDDLEIWKRGCSLTALIPKSRIDNTRIEQFNLADSLIQKHCVELWNKAMPDSRQYTLFRNLVELKDLPRSIISLRDTTRALAQAVQNIKDPSLVKVLMDLSHTSSKIPNEYLSYHFGWKQLYNDIRDLLSTPERIVKRFNYLNRKNASSRVLKASKKLIIPTSSISASFDWTRLEFEESIKESAKILREAQLSVTIGYGFNFPELLPVKFSEQKFWNMIGAVPTPQDLWNLVPWSWLIDWFTGADDYIEAIQRINSDRNLIDYGLISCDIRTTLTGRKSSRVRNTEVNTFTPWGGTKKETVTHIYHDYETAATAEFRTRVRKDLSMALSHLETTSDPSKLTGYRRSILSALISQSIWNSSRK